MGTVSGVDLEALFIPMCESTCGGVESAVAPWTVLSSTSSVLALRPLSSASTADTPHPISVAGLQVLLMPTALTF
jgi:hypothetical protein